VGRRGRFDALQTLKVPAWCVVLDATGRVLKSLQFDAGADLRLQFVQLAEKAMAARWVVEEHDPAMGFFFCHREGQRIHVRIQPTAPRNPLSSWPLPAPASSVEECFRI